MNESKIENIKKKVAFLTLGCKVNSYETNAMEKLFIDAGYEVNEFSEEADVYVVNTCTVTNMADRKSRQMIHKAKKRNPQAVVIAAGCYVEAAKDTLEQDDAIDVVIGNNQKNQIVMLVEQYLDGESSVEVFADIENVEKYGELTIETAGEKTRAYIKIQDGCNQFCSYCIIPYVRGRIRSRKFLDILSEVKRLVENGYKEVVLTGIHLSSYGVDFLEDKDFVKAMGKPLLELMDAINNVDGLERIRLGSLEPRIISDQFAKELALNNKFCPHFHLSLQSGCDDTLKRMNRKYTTKEYIEKCKILRKYFDNPSITTDVIVGFPGETEEEFSITKSFLENVSFAQMHIFKYSQRKGTKAEGMENQVPEPIKNQRSEELLLLSKTMKQQYQQLFVGTEQKVLIEETVEKNGILYQVGHNERYLKLAVADNQLNADKSNEILDVSIIGEVDRDILLAISNGLY